ncbi:hypothetical protein CYMTET_41868 [Cymbomonas tetramitiformis]|uniref:Uncharacterized protein n=1 Tax=Cymbomonas tetramitiformis TaxID=36881 RepID=A0AAE0C6Y8_9CHLO|nr:hypothetical protein CYMTET_41868 [Cymbomonas tetramitiformis]
MKASARPAPPGSIAAPAAPPAASAKAAVGKPSSAVAMHTRLPDDPQPAAVEEPEKEILDHRANPDSSDSAEDVSPPASPDGTALNAAASIDGSDDEQWPAFAPPKYWTPKVQGSGGTTDLD